MANKKIGQNSFKRCKIHKNKIKALKTEKLNRMEIFLMMKRSLKKNRNDFNK